MRSRPKEQEVWIDLDDTLVLVGVVVSWVYYKLDTVQHA